MAAPWTDAELLELCRRESAEGIEPQAIQLLRQRREHSEVLLLAIENSPLRSWWEAQFEKSACDDVALNDAAMSTTSSSRDVRDPKPFRPVLIWVVVVALLGVVGWFATRGRWPQEPVAETQDDGARESREAAVATATPRAAKTGEDSTQVSADQAGAVAGNDPMVDGPKSNETPVASQPTPVAADEVWSGPLDLQKPPLAVEETVWQPTAALSPDGLVPDVFHKWFSGLPGRPFNVSEDKVDKRVFTIFEGQARLRAPWVQDAVLRLALFNVERCEFSIWKGNDGIKLSFVKAQQPPLWIAQRVSRTDLPGDSKVDPKSKADTKSEAVLGELLGTDNSRWEMTKFGIFELRVEHGHLLIARGHVPLLRVPFEGLPTEVLIDGKFRMRDLRMYRGDPLPLQDLDAYRVPNGINQLASSNPAELNWQLKPDAAASLEKVATDGATRPNAIEFKTTAALKETAWVSLDVAKAGLSEVIFRVDHADAGTGVCIGATTGNPYSKLGFLLEPKSQRVVAGVPLPWLHPVELTKESSTPALAFLGPTQWFRLVGSAGSVQAWVSPDGRDWSWLGQHHFPNEWRRVDAIRVFAVPGAARRIQISHLQVREFPTITALADPALCQRIDIAAFEPLLTRDLGSWMHQVIRTRPDDVPLDAWRRACAVESLRVGTQSALGTALLSGLAYEGLFGSGRSGDERSQISDEAALERGLLHDVHLLGEVALLHHLADYNNGASFAQLWSAVADKWIGLSDGLPLAQGEVQRRVIGERFLEALLVQPLRSATHMKLIPFEPTRRELVSLVHAGRSADTLAWIDRLTFFVTDSHPLQFWWTSADPIFNTVLWSELNSHSGLDGEAQLRRLTLPRRWKSTPPLIRHALAQPLSKEAYNVMAEFNAAIGGQAFGDACQIIGAAANGQMLGILPDSRDQQLLVSFPRAVASAMEEHPELRLAMNDKYGATGRLRVRQAMEAGDVPVLEAATIQFYGTLAAAESERWLGDRAFAAGDFAQAQGHYQRAKDGFARNSQVQTTATLELAARMQLVAAMLGQEESATLTSTVAFGEQSLTKQQLDELSREFLTDIGEVRSGDVATQRSQTTVRTVSSAQVLSFGSYRLEARGRYAGEQADRVGDSAAPDIDWFSRQFAITVSDSHAFLSNRFQVSCLNLESGQIEWNNALSDERGLAKQLLMVPMQPLVVGESVFCRRLTKKGSELHGFEKSSGKLRWRTTVKTNIVSDPWISRGRLQVFAVDLSPTGPGELRLLTLQAETGRLISETPVVRLFDDTLLAGQTCQVEVRNGLVFFAYSGVVGCCDTQGQAVWLRRQLWQPPVMDSGRYQRAFDPLLLQGELLLVTQPGVPVIEALDVASGRVRWSRSASELRRMLGVSDGRLLLETQFGIEARDVATGVLEWRYRAADLLDAVVIPASGSASPARLVTMRTTDGSDGRKMPTLVWIDTNSGQEVGYQLLDALVDREPRFGPLLISDNKVFGFFGKGRADFDRQIYELVPNNDGASVASGAVITVDQPLWAGWFSEFQRSSFPANAFARPSFARRTLTPMWRDAYAKQAAGWVALAPPIQSRDAGIRAEFRGEQQVLAVPITVSAQQIEQNLKFPDVPLDAVRFMRQVSVGSNADAAIELRVGHDAGRSWELIIDAGSQRLHRSIINDETASSGWQDARVSLAPLAGKTTEIVVTCVPVAAGNTGVYLRRLILSDGAKQTGM